MKTQAHRAAIVRLNPAAKRLIADFPPGTQVKSVAGMLGEVTVVIPSTNAQGGSLRVRWENGEEGRVSPINVVRV